MCHFLYLPHIVNYIVSNKFKRLTYNIVWPNTHLKSIKPFWAPSAMNYNIQQQFMNFLWEGIRSRFQDSHGTLLRRSGFQQPKRSICFRKPISKLNEDHIFFGQKICWPFLITLPQLQQVFLICL